MSEDNLKSPIERFDLLGPESRRAHFDSEDLRERRPRLDALHRRLAFVPADGPRLSSTISIEYVNGRVHTNTIESFWSCVKRTLHGTYIAVRPFDLDAYLDEQVFRFNAREGNDADRFVAVLAGADGKRTTYAALTSSHPRWRLRPGRAARAAARRAMIAQEPITGKSDRI